MEREREKERDRKNISLPLNIASYDLKLLRCKWCKLKSIDTMRGFLRESPEKWRISRGHLLKASRSSDYAPRDELPTAVDSWWLALVCPWAASKMYQLRCIASKMCHVFFFSPQKNTPWADPVLQIVALNKIWMCSCSIVTPEMHHYSLGTSLNIPFEHPIFRLLQGNDKNTLW